MLYKGRSVLLPSLRKEKHHMERFEFLWSHKLSQLITCHICMRCKALFVQVCLALQDPKAYYNTRRHLINEVVEQFVSLNEPRRFEWETIFLHSLEQSRHFSGLLDFLQVDCFLLAENENGFHHIWSLGLMSFFLFPCDVQWLVLYIRPPQRCDWVNIQKRLIYTFSKLCTKA